MHYVILFYETEADFSARSGPDSEAYWGAWMAYTKSMQDAGVMRDGKCLETPGTATSVRIKGTTRKVQDGPFVDTKEQLGGVTVIDVPDLDTALEWAARAPSASTGVEVRPTLGC